MMLQSDADFSVGLWWVIFNFERCWLNCSGTLYRAKLNAQITKRPVLSEGLVMLLL